MNETKEKTDWSTWFSTYGVLTSQRILERFGINLPHDELIRSIKNPNSIYFKLLHVPLKNVFNGIIFQQAHDYQIYAQKLFVDYLLSGEDAKEKDAPGAEARADVEQERIQLIQMGDGFRQVEEAHQILIAESQKQLIEFSTRLATLDHEPKLLQDGMVNYVERAEDININLRNFRSQFYNLILRTTELFRCMTDYKLNEEKIAENRVTLEFDPLIGE